MPKSQRPLVSIIVPIYNVEHYLDDCVQSIVDQTYPDLEILLVDDGSPDGCGAICDAWAEKDARITALHKPNGGLSDARNYGIDRAHGEYVYCVDSDDWIQPNLVERALDVALDTDSDLVVFEYNSASDDGSVVRPSDDVQKFPSEGRRSSEQALKLLWDDKVQNFAWSYLVHRSVYDTGIRFPKGYLMEDMGTAYLLYDAANAVYFLPEPLYNYRVRPNSILGVKSQAMCEGTAHFIQIIDRFAQSHYYPQLRTEELNWSIRYLTGAIIWAYESRKRFKPGEYKAFVKSTRKLVTARIKALGIRNMTNTNKVKSLAVYLHCVPIMDIASQRRSGRML
ncbi:glycosyltransferase family 2 protein [Bifidobacterium castoris]|uniref:Glycosyl transferase CpsJ n=1 Tax=Bifidobacterium castoris TaxID=2306972 RepID=A0A430F6B3_9BIFI|nr:glycosyltransferase [Bifidobacterium castoris]MDE5640330.1 glycosyltransferase [Bifidobacterium castoris]RSX47262.1 glycosyl transferase CpsJ [Bifidobacterium castoris]